MGKKEASSETIANIYKVMGKSIEELFPVLYNNINVLNQLEEINLDKLTEDNRNIIKFFSDLLKINTSIIFVNIEINALIRSTIRAQSPSEKRANIKYINFIIVEGYRYLFDKYGENKPEVDPAWCHLKSSATLLNNTECLEDLSKIENKASMFAEKYIKKGGKLRNYAIHYDLNVTKIYDYLIGIDNEDIEYDRVISYLAFVKSILQCTSKWMKLKSIPVDLIASNFTIPLTDIISKEIGRNNDVYNAPNLVLLQSTKFIDDMMKENNGFDALIKKFNLSSIDNNADRFEIKQSVYPSIFLSFIKIDLASLSRAYLKSECFFERVLHLNRINIILYEGLKKLYGVSDSERLKSFWTTCILKHVDDNTPVETFKFIKNIENEIIDLINNPVVNDINRRNHSSHYRHCDNDYLIPRFNDIVGVNPIIELERIKKILSLVIKVEKCNQLSVDLLKIKNNCRYQTKNDKFIAKIDEKIDILLNTSNCPENIKHSLDNTKQQVKKLF